MTRARELSKLGNPNVIAVDSSNNIGIGSTTPDAKVDLGGEFIVGSGASITTAGEAVFAGVVTATSFSGSGANLTGVGTQGIDVSAKGLVIAGISTFYDDVLIKAGGLDVVGVVTSNNKVVATGLDIGTAGVDIDGQTDLDELVVAGVSTFSANVKVDNGCNTNLVNGTVTVGTGITISATAGFGTFSKGVKLGKGGLLVEGISSVSAGFDNTSDLNLDDGMVHYTNDALAGNANTLNLTSSVGVNTAMALNEMIVVTGITSVSNTSHYVNDLTIDNVKPRNICWVGGAAPTEGGSTGFDVYTFTIWKTGNSMFNVIANQTTTTA